MTMEDAMNQQNHNQARRSMHAAADNLLEASERNKLDDHLASCAECRSYAEQINTLEGNIRTLFHKQWDTASTHNVNLLPGIRVRYRRKMMRNQLDGIANTLVTACLLIGLLILLNWFLSSRQSRQVAGNNTPTPTLSTPTPVKPTSTPTLITTPTTQPAENQPADEPPAGSLVFVSSHEELGDLYFINADGSGQIKLFDDQQSLSLSPAWSPDGKKLVFVSNQDGNSEIYIINADGTEPIRLTDNLAEDDTPAWSPDGIRIAFASDRTGYIEVYVVDTIGLNVTQLTFTQASNTHPTWSNDGSQIAFASNRDGYWQIYRMNSDGSGQTNLTNDPSSDDREPTWSPDGRMIAYVSQKNNEQDQEISIMNADGSGRAPLTENTPSMGKSADDYSPAWSPDNQWLAFCSNRDNSVYGDIYAIRVGEFPTGSLKDGSSTTIRLTTEGGSHPAWKP